MSKLKDPHQKKEASYAHDRRNTYGENSKASRKNIPLAKARVHRAERHQVHAALHQPPLDALAAEEVETVVAESKLKRLDGFKKEPDQPLGVVLASKGKRTRAQLK